MAEKPDLKTDDGYKRGRDRNYVGVSPSGVFCAPFPGLRFKILSPFEELFLNLRSDRDPQQLATPIVFRPHIFRATHGALRLSPIPIMRTKPTRWPFRIRLLRKRWRVRPCLPVRSCLRRPGALAGHRRYGVLPPLPGHDEIDIPSAARIARSSPQTIAQSASDSSKIRTIACLLFKLGALFRGPGDTGNYRAASG
jgi:hypothetical protein